MIPRIVKLGRTPYGLTEGSLTVRGQKSGLRGAGELRKKAKVLQQTGREGMADRTLVVLMKHRELKKVCE